jgi:hypothetical protein
VAVTIIKMARTGVFITLTFAVIEIALKIEAFPFMVRLNFRSVKTLPLNFLNLQADKMFRMHKIEMCDFGATPPIVLVANLTGTGGKNQLSVGGILNVTQDLIPPLKVSDIT